MTMQQLDNRLLGRMLSEGDHDLEWDSFSPADWDRIVRLAQVEGVASILYWRLTQSGRLQLLPEVSQKSLRAMYFSVKMNNEAIIKELETLTRLFDEAEIPVVALKGVCFALTIYPDIGRRPMADLDLLVPASKFSDAVRIVKTLGYVDTIPETFPGLRDLLHDEISLQKTDAPFIMLEIHNSLLVDKSFTYAVPVDWFWEQTEPLNSTLSEIKFENLRMLTPTAQLLYAAAHAMLKHGGRDTTLRWYYDLDRLIRFYAGRVDWDVLLLQAKAFQWGSALQVALLQTSSYFSTPIPDRVLVELSENIDSHRHLVALKQTKPSTHMLEEYENLIARNWYGRLILILGLILPGPAYMRWRYGLKNSWALPACYLYRWWSIFRDILRTVIILVQKRLHGSHLEMPPNKSH